MEDAPIELQVLFALNLLQLVKERIRLVSQNPFQTLIPVVAVYSHLVNANFSNVDSPRSAVVNLLSDCFLSISFGKTFFKCRRSCVVNCVHDTSSSDVQIVDLGSDTLEQGTAFVLQGLSLRYAVTAI